jgi:spermidine/putrescine transport system substrate-binding protein
MAEQDNKHGPWMPNRLTRRSALRAAGGALALSSAGSFLAACGGGSSSASTSGASGGAGTSGIGGIPIATKDHPVKLPTYSDNPPIPSGRKPEKGPLVIFDWGAYLSPDVVKSFEQRYGVTAQLTTFSSIDEATKKITSGAVKPDVWVPVVERLPQIVAAKLIQPINHSYISSLGNVVPSFQSPWYDQGSQYSVPNYIWTTGIAWRNDLIDIDPKSMSNPWSVFWTAPGTTGKMGLQNADPFDALSLAFLKEGFTNFDHISQSDVDKALADVQQLTGAKNAKLQYTGFQPLGNGVEMLAQAWNGDVLLFPQYLPSGTPATAISFYFPPDGKGSVNSDFWCIPRTAQHPVLAHKFMDHFLQTEAAISNYKSVGYQQPLASVSLKKLKAEKVADPYILDMVYVTPTVAANGLPNPIPTAAQNAAYETAYAQLSAGAS